MRADGPGRPMKHPVTAGFFVRTKKERGETMATLNHIAERFEAEIEAFLDGLGRRHAEALAAVEKRAQDAERDLKRVLEPIFGDPVGVGFGTVDAAIAAVVRMRLAESQAEDLKARCEDVERREADAADGVEKLLDLAVRRAGALAAIGEALGGGVVMEGMADAVRALKARCEGAERDALASDVGRIRDLLGARDAAGKALDLTEAVKALKEELAACQKERDRAQELLRRSAYEVMRRQRDDERTRRETAEALLAERNREIDGLRKELEAAKTRSAGLDGAWEDLADERDAAQREAASLRAQLAEAEERIKEHIALSKEKGEQRDNAIKERDALQVALRAQNRRLLDAWNDAAANNAEKGDTVRALREQLAESQEKISTLSDMEADERRSHKAWRRKAEDLEVAIFGTEAKRMAPIAEAVAEAHRLRSELVALRAQLEGTDKAAQARVAAALAERDAAQSRETLALATVQTLRSQLESLRSRPAIGPACSVDGCKSDMSRQANGCAGCGGLICAGHSSPIIFRPNVELPDIGVFCPDCIAVLKREFQREMDLPTVPDHDVELVTDGAGRIIGSRPINATVESFQGKTEPEYPGAQASEWTRAVWRQDVFTTRQHQNAMKAIALLPPSPSPKTGQPSACDGCSGAQSTACFSCQERPADLRNVGRWKCERCSAEYENHNKNVTGYLSSGFGGEWNWSRSRRWTHKCYGMDEYSAARLMQELRPSPKTGRLGRWRCRMCGGELDVATKDIHALSFFDGKWTWHAGVRETDCWLHWCTGWGGSPTDRIGDAPEVTP